MTRATRGLRSGSRRALAATSDDAVNAALETCGNNLVVALTGDEATIRAALASPAP